MLARSVSYYHGPDSLTDFSLKRPRGPTTAPDQALMSNRCPHVNYSPEFGLFTFEGMTHRPEWLGTLLPKVAELMKLPPDWDSYGARRISPESLVGALNLLLATMTARTPVPALVPTTRGGVRLEWHVGARDLEVDVPPVGPWHLYYEDEDKPSAIVEQSVGAHGGPLAELLTLLQ